MDRDSGVSLRGGEETEGDQAGGSKPRRFWQFWLSLPGFITAIASLLGALAALAALFVHQNQQLTQRTEALQQATSRPQPTVTVTETVTASPPPLPGPGPGPSPTVPPPPGSRYLADLDPVDVGFAFYSPETAIMSNRSYPHSVEVGCTDSYMIYNTSGSSKLIATLGVADSASDANGAIADISFYDQDDRQIDKTFSVSVAHPTAVTIDLTGVVQTKITCSGRDRVNDDSRWFHVMLGDAALAP
ncbi:MAG TPA: hypothetical protein VKE25_01310 [Actinomycetes bacterium]|nr:hypothetical protein [Actinomycetes bacterium]